ncbi:ORF6N domain-containing protein [Alkaliphilus oremlandii]|uniref:KilA-N DNA-binding domain-containing protein n=1 Tax=Alkaliphilus oremlandii (strain OhILAs) TaxID=350688 RepID=A8MHZ4_ALKOO|nr:ORF6N domain-containing protein [Alkaliphilus oremlandii]ABW19426.1 hypothetical protein Clos_1886 [Alkaliphilus oremlandii OhILAs]
MNDLILKGKFNLDDMEFCHIEGGFGRGKKSMLAKDIAQIHKKTIDEINRAVNRNRKRFKDNIDIIDLKDTNFVTHLMSNGIYTQNAMNRSNNIYLLSERGYAKLLKILEDDFAWEQYEKLVDGYFNMRELIEEKQVLAESIKTDKIDIHKEKLDKAMVTSNYLVEYVKSMSGYMPSHLLESFTTAIQAVNIDIVDSLKKMNKFNQPESRQ